MKYQNSTSPFISMSRSDRGSAMIIAIIFTVIITLGIAGILPLALTEWKMSNRISGQEAAFTLAEAGTDEAIWAILEFGENESDWEADGWAESSNGSYWYREWDLSGFTADLGESYELDEERIGKYRVIVEKVNGSTINIVSQGIVDGGKNVAGDYIASRFIETQFERSNPFQGLISIMDLTMNGGTTSDSIDSNDIISWIDMNLVTLKSYFTENTIVGSLSQLLSDLNLGNADINGGLVTGASDDGTDPAAGSAVVSGATIYDFDMELPVVDIPDTSAPPGDFDAIWESNLL